MFSLLDGKTSLKACRNRSVCCTVCVCVEYAAMHEQVPLHTRFASFIIMSILFNLNLNLNSSMCTLYSPWRWERYGDKLQWQNISLRWLPQVIFNIWEGLQLFQRLQLVAVIKETAAFQLNNDKIRPAPAAEQMALWGAARTSFKVVRTNGSISC